MNAKLSKDGKTVQIDFDDGKRITTPFPLTAKAKAGDLKSYLLEFETWLENNQPEAYDENDEIERLTVATKLEIRRAMRNLGVENSLDLLLAGSVEFQNDWNDAVEINFNDELTQQALQNINNLTQIKTEIYNNRKA